jgi:hypothetical protein
MKNIITNKSFDRFCYVDENNNMIDITNKCPIELCKNFKKIIKDKVILDKSIIDIPVEDIYHHIIEKTYSTPSWMEEVNFNNHSKKKLIIAFNKFFFNKLNENV